FTQKWIGDAVKKLLQKEDIYESDMERIKYLRIGDCDFGYEYSLEMSTAAPPEPYFGDTCCGDEWEPGVYGPLTGRFIRLYIDYAKENPFDSIDPETGERTFQLSDFKFWHQYEEEYKETEEDEWEDIDIEKEQKDFEKTILYERYRENISDEDAYDEWFRRTGWAIQQDIRLFSGLEVLRLYGAKYQDLTFLRAMPLLRVLEVVETDFVSLEGIDDLARLKQLCCWLD
ncbi:MAG: hypothetical protein K2K74_09595, partial [Lachnospiraceae bacterium]|nr:hypothetical protein [Lachnospiraceae bacterium]